MSIRGLVTLGGRPRRWLWVALAVLLAGDACWTFIWFPRQSQHRVYSEANLPETHCPVLILGAAVTSDREPTEVLENRLETALRLFNAGKVTWFLVSGDNRAANHNEPMVMRRWLIKRGVPEPYIISDFAGRRTYDSLKRARSIFNISKVVVVTSDFHLARTLFISQHIGLDTLGVASPTTEHPWLIRLGFWSREYFARHLAYLEVWFPPDTVLGPPEPTPDSRLGKPSGP